MWRESTPRAGRRGEAEAVGEDPRRREPAPAPIHAPAGASASLGRLRGWRRPSRQRQAGCEPVVTLCLPPPVAVIIQTCPVPDFGVYV